jgi:hypothetical protein
VRVLVLHDVSQAETRFGVRRRLEHLAFHEEAAGNSVEVRSVVPASRPRPGRPERLLRVLAESRKWAVADVDKVIVVALAAPHMVVLARALAKRLDVPVQVDVCDSSRLLAAERRRTWGRSRRLRAVTSEALARAAFARLPPGLTRSYISRRDADADADLSASEALVVGPAPLPDLADVGPFVGRPRSVLFPVDGTSVEGRMAVTVLLEVVADSGIDVPIEISGTAPAGEPPGAVRWLGHVPTLHELYARPCVVVSTNAAAHGVQNKLWEAFQAWRPIVAFEAALHWAPEVPWIHRIRRREDFGPGLRRALEMEYDTGTGAPLSPEDREHRLPRTSGERAPQPVPGARRIAPPTRGQQI